MAPTLSSTWVAGTGNGTLQLRLDLGATPPQDADRLCVTTQLFPLSGSAVKGAKLLRAEGSFHELDLPDGTERTVQIELGDLAFAPRHYGEGPRSAYIVTLAGGLIPVSVSRMTRDPVLAPPASDPLASASRSGPLCVPWPNRMDLTGLSEAPCIDLSEIGPQVSALHRMIEAVGLDTRDVCDGSGQTLRHSIDPGMHAEAYRLRFEASEIFVETGEKGVIPGFATLVQLLLGAQDASFFPAPGSRIEDAPAFGWRGFHLDCARHFFPVEQIERVLVLMAILKLNRFHWHLTDDEAWRPEIAAFPELADIGGSRGPGQSIPSQFSDGADVHSGTYSRGDMIRVVESARHLGIDVLPEIDLPGHSTALLKALPDLVDTEEAPDSYRSVQNFANNSLNPAVPGAMETVEEIINDLLTIFPGQYLHLGGDELPKNAWSQSPVATEMAADAGFDATDALQHVFFRRMQNCLGEHGRTLAVWDEQGRIGSIGPESLVFCWQDPEVAGQLTNDGYPVVICPAQACYLDIAQSADWFASGSGWAGVVTLRDSYDFDPLAGIAPQNLRQVVGVQACLWTETVETFTDFEAATYPRVLAVAETAWTLPDNKDFARFRAQAEVLEHALRKPHVPRPGGSS